MEIDKVRVCRPRGMRQGWACFALGLSMAWTQVQATPLIVIDAGHTLAAQGARAAGDGRAELLFNQDLAGRVARDLEELGVSTRMANSPARAKEDFAQRAAAGLGADFFLSVHHDSAKESLLSRIEGPSGPRWEDGQGRFKGFALFVDPRDAKGVLCARMVGRRMRLAGETPSLYHATRDFGESRALVDAENGVHSFPGLALARLRKAPMALLEAGVIVEPSESTRLRDPVVVERIAQAVAHGLLDCHAVGLPQ